jgi:hypothetical protein
MSSESSRERLPFEPAKTRKKTPKKPSEPLVQGVQNDEPSKPDKESLTIPETVSQRMIARIGIFSGVPTGMGILTFILSYFVVKNHLFPLANTAVVLVSMAFFGFGVLGLTYGALSSSWDEDIPGSVLGWQEFNTNWTRMRGAWRSTKPKS